MKSTNKFKRSGQYLLILSMFFLQACQEEEVSEIDPNEPTLEFHDYLNLTDASKVTGALPSAPQGDLKINFSDTIYLIQGHPYKARLGFKHEANSPVTEFNIWVDGLMDEHYYKASPSPESNDSITIVYIGMVVPETIPFPYVTELIIQPVGPAGPLDEFIRTVSVEEPYISSTQSGCSPMTENGSAWTWLYTEMYKADGNLFRVTAPNFSASYAVTGSPGYYYGKCCWTDPDFGFMEAYPGDQTPEGECKSGNPYYKQVYIDGAYTLMPYEYILLFNSGVFHHHTASIVVNFVPQKSRICDLFAYYDRKDTKYFKSGTHDYTEGSQSITMTTTVATPAFGPVPPRGNIVKTCNLLVLNHKLHEEYNFVYQRFPAEDIPGDPDEMDYLIKWFD